MGIFGSQGEYAKLAPLFVDKFDTEPTFSKLNKAYSAGDEQANINATTALSQEQGYANSIHQQHQAIIAKVDSGEMSPFKYERLAKETAHNYVNDPTRRTLELNKQAYDQSKKANEGKVSSYGSEKKSLGLQALKGGGSQGVRYTGFNAEDVDMVELATKAASNANEDLNVNWKGDPTNKPQIGIDKATGMLTVSKTEHEQLARTKVAEGVKKMLDSDPKVASFLENTAYGDLYDRYDYRLRVNPETAGLTEEQRNALIYEKLYSPDPKKYKDSKGVERIDNRSPLQRQMDAKKEQIVSGVSGLKAYDKYKYDFNAQNLPNGDGSKKPEIPTTPGATMTPDNITPGSIYNNLENKIAGDISDATSLTRVIGAGAVESLIDGLTIVKDLFKEGPNRFSGIKASDYKDRTERVNEMLPKAKEELLKNGVSIKDIPQLKADGSNVEEVARIIKKKSEIAQSLKAYKYLQPEALITDKNLPDVIKRVDISGDQILTKNDKGEPVSIPFKELLKGSDYGIDLPDKIKNPADRLNWLQENIKVSGIVSQKGKVMFKGSIGGKELYLPVKDVHMKDAYSGLTDFKELVNKDFNEEGKASIPLPKVDSFTEEAKRGYTQLNKKVVYVPETNTSHLTYYFSGPGIQDSNAYRGDQLSARYADLGKSLLTQYEGYQDIFTDKTQ